MNLLLHSQRLLLRPLEASDADIQVAIDTDPDVMKYVARPLTEAEAVRDMPKYVRRCAGGCIGIGGLVDSSTKEKVGTACLLPMPIEEEDTDWDLVTGDDLPGCEIEVGYMLRKSAWGKGYATETCFRLLRFAFEDSPLGEVVAVTDPDNAASRRVIEKCGLVYEGLRRAYANQCSGYRITRPQWLEKCRELPFGRQS